MPADAVRLSFASAIVIRVLIPSFRLDEDEGEGEVKMTMTSKMEMKLTFNFNINIKIEDAGAGVGTGDVDGHGEGDGEAEPIVVRELPIHCHIICTLSLLDDKIRSDR